MNERDIGSLCARQAELERRQDDMKDWMKELDDKVDGLRLGHAQQNWRWGQVVTVISVAAALAVTVFGRVLDWAVDKLPI